MGTDISMMSCKVEWVYLHRNVTGCWRQLMARKGERGWVSEEGSHYRNQGGGKWS